MRRIRILISLFIIMMMGFASCSKANSETQSVRSEPLQGRILFKWGGFERDPKISMSGNGICVYQNGKMEKFWHRGSGGKWVNGKVLMSPSDLAIKDPVTGKNIMEEYLVDFLTKKNIRKITIKHSGIIRCFSKDEKYIFGTVHEPTDKEWIWIENVFKYNTETGEFKKLTDFKEPGNFIPTIDLSPDETKLLFDHQIKKTDTKSQIEIRDLEGNLIEILQINGMGPKWSPDGKKIVFDTVFPDEVASNKRATEIALYDLETKELKRLTNLHGISSNPDFSPDGKQIVFVVWDFGGRAKNLGVINVDGTGFRRLLPEKEAIGISSPDWGP